MTLADALLGGLGGSNVTLTKTLADSLLIGQGKRSNNMETKNLADLAYSLGKRLERALEALETCRDKAAPECDWGDRDEGRNLYAEIWQTANHVLYLERRES